MLRLARTSQRILLVLSTHLYCCTGERDTPYSVTVLHF